MVSFDYITTTMASYGYADPIAGTIFESGSGESQTVKTPAERSWDDHEHKIYEMNTNPYHWINSSSFYGFMIELQLMLVRVIMIMLCY